jgi:hypothetical protein
VDCLTSEACDEDEEKLDCESLLEFVDFRSLNAILPILKVHELGHGGTPH